MPAVAGILLSGMAFGQTHRCAVLEHEQYLEQKNPKRQQQREAYNQRITDWMNARAANKTATPAITIPVVVHVVYKTAIQNISDAQVFSQIEVLNQDFNRLNPDTNNTPAVWQSIAGSANVTFCLAQVDPSGNPTSGIERRQTTANSFSTNDAIKSYATGGLDAWDPSQYFNIWVGPLGGGLLGYAEFPTASLSNTYGVVIGYDCFGTIGTAASPFDGGRTATHEIGHCFNLYHIWGDDGSACSGSDQVSDTPNQGSENYGCPTFPHTDACATSSPGVMFMNYMDYTDDGCMNLFTQGQVNRMLAIVNNPPYNALANSTVCNSAVLVANDAMLASITNPGGNECNSTITPQITLKNMGLDTLYSVDINYYVDNNTPSVYAWTGILPSLTSTGITLPAITTTAGAHTFTVFTSQPNGSNDLNTVNDSSVASFTVVGNGLALPYQEGFETAFPPAGGALNNPDNSYTWEQTTSSSHSGTHAVYINNYDYNGSGAIDEIVLPAVDLTSQTAAKISFYVAYQLYTSPSTSPNYSDTLEVMLSTDCGDSYTSLYKKYSSALTTTTPVFSTTAFVPTSTQWRRDSIDLSAYAGFSNVQVKMKAINDYENNLWLDDINIENATTTGLQESASGTIQVYTNPVGHTLMLDLSRMNDAAVRVRILDMTGRVILTENNIPGGYRYEFPADQLSAGSYLLEVTGDKSQKILTFVKK